MITLLAEEPANSGPDFGKASPVGLLVVVLLLIGVFFLVRSMNRHLRKVPASFGAAAESAGASEPADSGDARQPESGRSPDAGEPTHEPGG